jgi:hypothetical protein
LQSFKVLPESKKIAHHFRPEQLKKLCIAVCSGSDDDIHHCIFANKLCSALLELVFSSQPVTLTALKFYVVAQTPRIMQCPSVPWVGGSTLYLMPKPITGDEWNGRVTRRRPSGVP